MSTFIPKLHTEIRQARLTRRGATHHENDVPTGRHKIYERMENLVLPEPAPLQMDLADALAMRKSAISCGINNTFSLAECGTLLGHALRKRADDTVSRNYPSGGALFPIETYIVGLRIDHNDPATYHYNPTKHALEKLWALPLEYDIKSLARRPDTLLFSALIVFTSVWSRSSAKYGDFTYPLALLEAGHMSENVVLTATAMNLATRPMAGFNDDALIELLDIDANEEQPVHAVTLCRNTDSYNV